MLCVFFPFKNCKWDFLHFFVRFLLDNRHYVEKKSVLDIGSGCGALAIVSKMLGATRVLANDIDPGMLTLFLHYEKQSSIFICYIDFEYSDFWPHLYCYLQNISANLSFGLLQVFHVELSAHTESQIEPFIWSTGVDCSNPVNHDQVQVLSYYKYLCYSYL